MKFEYSPLPPPSGGLSSFAPGDEEHGPNTELAFPEPEGDMELVEDPNQYPYSSVARVEVNFKKGPPQIGTAWFVGPSVLVTAGHVLFDPGRGPTLSVIVHPPDTPAPIFQSTPAKDIAVAEPWKKSADRAFDLGAVLLPSTVGKTAGWLGFGSYPDQVLHQVSAEVCGYPAATVNGTKLHRSRRKLHDVQPAFVEYRADVLGGHSGGPVMVPAGGKWWVIAVNTQPLSFEANAGVRVTPQIAALFKKWRNG